MIYLDYNATHPPDTESIEQATRLYFSNFYNSSGLSAASQKVLSLLEDDRAAIAELLSTRPENLYFTASATEANAIILRSLQKKREVFTTPFEHPSVTENLHNKENTGTLELEADHTVSLSSLEEKLEKNPQLLAVIAGSHNETGLCQPLPAVFSIFSRYPEARLLCDMSQSLPKMVRSSASENTAALFGEAPPNVYFTAAGHKTGAGFGCSILSGPAEADGLELYSGGNQEAGIRPGSHDFRAVHALRLTLEKRLNDRGLVPAIEHNTELFEKALKEETGAEIICENSPRLPGTTLALFKNTQIDFMMMALDRAGITVSTGTSCKSRSRSPSPALLAMGFSEDEALSVIRFSYGAVFTADRQQKVIAQLKNLTEALV